MTILSIDTSTPHASVAVTRNDHTLSQRSFEGKKTFSSTLLTRVHECLESAGCSLDAVDAFAVARGPGSFTGLRLGISLVTGFSMATGKPAVGIDTLYAMALSPPPQDGLICPLLDARKNEVYAAVFEYRDGTLTRIREDVAEIPEAFLEKIPARALFFGTGAARYEEKIRTFLKDKADIALGSFERTTAAAVGALAREYLNKPEERGDNGIRPKYVRPCEAEIQKALKQHIH